MITFAKNDAPLLIVMGQSNAHAHGTVLPEDQRITTPLKNVYGLDREFNQAYGLDDVTWSGFTTHGMNLGETQDHTCCLANVFAAKWQKAIDEGASLPDLYIIQISVGAQGIAQFETRGWNMWYPMRDLILNPGSLTECNISLYPLATDILSLATMNLIAAGKNPRVIGLHWNQWETEAETGSRAIHDAEANYKNLFWGFFTALGGDKNGRISDTKKIPLYLYRPLSENYPADNTAILVDLFESFRDTYADCRILDLRTSPYYSDTPKLHGIFRGDGCHYKDEAHRWFAERQWEDLFSPGPEEEHES